MRRPAWFADRQQGINLQPLRKKALCWLLCGRGGLRPLSDNWRGLQDNDGKTGDWYIRYAWFCTYCQAVRRCNSGRFCHTVESRIKTAEYTRSACGTGTARVAKKGQGEGFRSQDESRQAGQRGISCPPPASEGGCLPFSKRFSLALRWVDTYAF